MLILGGMALGVALLRRLAGESRISQLDVETILRVPLTQMGLGVFTSLKLFLYTNPKMAFINLDLETVKLSTAVMAGVFFLILWWGSKEKSKTNSQEGELKSEDLTFKKEAQRILVGIAVNVRADEICGPVEPLQQGIAGEGALKCIPEYFVSAVHIGG